MLSLSLPKFIRLFNRLTYSSKLRSFLISRYFERNQTFTDMTENEIAKIVLVKSFEIHRALGPGLLESVYEKALEFELSQNKILVASQVPVPLVYKEIKFESGFRLDLLVENKVIVEIKANVGLAPVHFA